MSAAQQEEELSAVQSIYEDCFEIVSNEFGKAEALFRTKIDFPEEKPLRVATGCDCDEKAGEREVSLRMLPPVTLRIQLPANYPSEAPPKYSLSCVWLSRESVRKLKCRFCELWEEAASSGSGVLFGVVSFLQTEMLEYLNVSTDKVFELQHELRRTGVGRQESVDVATESGAASGHNDTTLRLELADADCSALAGAGDVTKCTPTVHPAKQRCQALHTLLRTLTEFDAARREAEFSNSLVECQVCCDVRFGRESTRLDKCGHIFCLDCLRQYVETRMAQNDVVALQCPAHACETPLPHAAIRRVVSATAYERFEKQLLDASLAMMNDVVYCPRPVCGQPVLTEPSSNMAICSSCALVFCSFCFHSFHGVAPCSLKLDKMLQLRNVYLNADATARKALEARHGKHMIKQAVEEAASIEWLRENAKPCPTCGFSVQKLDGCNKMTCTKCGGYFCWLCAARLDKTDPYRHFRDGTACAGQLFLGATDTDGDDDDAWLEAGWFEDDDEDDDVVRFLR